jgi:hypothetical protein
MSWVKDIDSVVEQLTVQIEALKKKADDTIPAVKPIVTHKNTWDACSKTVKSLFQTNFRGWGTSDDFTTTHQYQMKLLELMKSYKEQMDAHTLNKNINADAIENNKKVIEKVTSIMKYIGIPSTYTTSTYKTSRSRKPTTETHNAGWLQDIRRAVPTSDNWEQIKRDMESKMREIELYANQKIKEFAAVEKEADRIAAEKALTNYATTMKIKHGFDYSSDEHAVLEGLLTVLGEDHEEYKKLKDLLYTYKALS